MTRLPLPAWRAAISRRTALGAAGAALAGAVAVPLTQAQSATPAPDAARRVFTMFVQTAQAGSFVPKPDTPDVYEVSLEGVTVQTIYFTDRPERVVGTVPTGQFLDALGFTPFNPPNAAIVAHTDEGEDILVVELFNPRWDEATLTLTYDVQVLAEYAGDGLGHLATRQADDELPASFGQASLFIDDCADVTTCWAANGMTAIGEFPGGARGQCWTWSPFGCYPCDGRTQRELADICNETYAACDGECRVDPEPLIIM